jgi:hypothetical protein
MKEPLNLIPLLLINATPTEVRVMRPFLAEPKRELVWALRAPT